MSKNNYSKEKTIQDKLDELELIKKNNKFWNISKEQGEILAKIILNKKPKNILEIGTSNGYSTLYLAKNLEKDSKITTIEVNDERYEIAKNNFSDCNIKNIIQIKGEILEILNTDILKNEKFDFIFLDALQREYLNLIKIIEEQNLLTTNGIIIADNVLSHGNMAEFIKYMQEKYKTEIIEIDDGFLIAENK